MDDATRKRLAASLGLADSATESQINTRLQERALAGNPTSGAEGGDPDTAGTPGKDVTPDMEPPDNQSGPAPTGTAPSGVESDEPLEEDEEEANQENEPDTQAGFVKLDSETYKRLKAGAEAGLRLEKQGTTSRQHAAVEAAIKAGKIPSARRAHYRKLMAMDEQGTTQQLNELSPGLVPVSEVGVTGNTSEGEITAGMNEGLPDSWFPGLAQRKQAIAASTSRVTNAREG